MQDAVCVFERPANPATGFSKTRRMWKPSPWEEGWVREDVTQFLRNLPVRISFTVRVTMTLWLRLKNDSISCNASDE
jgi:hypothetical protein